jgi:hypothetical protein
MAVVKSIGAVVAGIAFVAIASIATDLLLQHTLMPAMNTREATPPVLALALAYRAYGIIAGWITAKLAPDRAMTHAVILGAIGTIASAGGAIATWSWGNHWYPIALTLLSIPQTWLGGRIAVAGAHKIP